MNYRELPEGFDPYSLTPPSASLPPSAVDNEATATIRAFEACGFTLPTDMTTSALFSGIGGAFITEEFPPAQLLPDVGLATRAYFGKTVQPTLERSARRQDEKSLQLAYQVGRLMGAAMDAELLTAHPPLDIVEDTIGVDGHLLAFDVQTGTVIEYGLGFNGLVTHIRNVKAGQYSVIGIQKTLGETMALQGLADYNGVPSDNFQILDRGIEYRTKGLLREGNQPAADLVVASRVHGAGQDLRTGINRASQLLRPDGLLVARGPSHYSQGLGYDTLAGIVLKSPELEVVVNHKFDIPTPRGRREENRLVVARRVG